jgi:hypothetical protein
MNITYVPDMDGMNPPSTLPRPYKHELSVADYRQMLVSLKSLEKEPDFLNLQYYLLSEKSITYGKRLGVFLLGVWPGAFTSGDPRGSTVEEWDSVCQRVNTILTNSLPGITPYKQDWSGKLSFQFRFETYVRFLELA